MANQMMIDIETFDTRPSAVVFQIGLVVFEDPITNPQWEILDKNLFHLDITEQLIAGRTVSEETQLFWAGQDRSAWDRDGDVIYRYGEMIHKIRDLVSHHDIRDVWSNSPSFDAVILRSLHEDLDLDLGEFPFSFHSDMDLRTLRNLMGRMGRLRHYEAHRETTHNALKDCEDQVFLLGFMLREWRDMNDIVGKYENGELTDYAAPNPDTTS